MGTAPFMILIIIKLCEIISVILCIYTELVLTAILSLIPSQFSVSKMADI